MKKLVLGVTAPGSIILIEGQLNYFRQQGYKTYLITQDEPKVREFCKKEGCEFLPIKINRDITVFSDFKTLIQIYKHFRKVQPDIVNVGTSKMGLLGTIAAFICRVPHRIYTARGLRFETETGLKRVVLINVLRIVGLLTHKIICISDAVRLKGIANNVFPAHKAIVIHKGSSNGINLAKFERSEALQSRALLLREELNSSDSFIFGFVGRINDRKGINELVEAFSILKKKYSNIKLLIVGPVELSNLKDKTVLDKIENDPNCIAVGFQSDVPLYLSIMDVFVLPTWTEGFGNVFIQAAAMKIPIIGTRALGVQNAVSDGFNGVLVDVKNVSQLTEKMELLYLDADLRNRFAENGYTWSRHFDNKVIWEGQKSVYEELCR